MPKRSEPLVVDLSRVCVCVAAEVYDRHGMRQGVAVQPQSENAQRKSDDHIQRAPRSRLLHPEESVLSQELPVRRRLDCQSEFAMALEQHCSVATGERQKHRQSVAQRGGGGAGSTPPPKSATEFVGVTNCNLWKLEVKLSLTQCQQKQVWRETIRRPRFACVDIWN